MTKNTETEQDQNNSLPILYKSLVPLMKDMHKDLKLVNNQNFKFTANSNAVPIVIQELPMAAKHFPIVFAGDASGVMLAVLGIKSGLNLFVDEDGRWRKDTYIPAYIRRYPFIVARADENSIPVICFDETSSALSNDGDVPLFKDGKATDDLNRIMNFTYTFQQHIDGTVEYVRMLEEKGLLEDQAIRFSIKDEVKANVDGFKTINRAKFDELSGETLKEWLTKGWVDASILHLSSGSNFDRVWQMDLERNAK